MGAFLGAFATILGEVFKRAAEYSVRHVFHIFRKY